MATVIGTATINRNPSIESNWSIKRFNQYTKIAADGTRKTYDGGITILTGNLVIKNVDVTEGNTLRTYITDTSVFGKNSFTIDVPAGFDGGAGVGTDITTAYFNQETLEGVFQTSPNGLLYTVVFPYWKKLT